MFFRINVILCFCLFCIQSSYAFQTSELDNIYNSKISSVLVYKTGNELHNPVISLYGGETIDVRFDFLDHEFLDIRYELQLCTKNWTLSSLQSNEYLKTIGDLRSENSYNSVGFQPAYVHYAFSFPNENLSFLKSGNYLLSVFDNSSNEKLFQKRIIVVENLVGVGMQVNRPYEAQFQNESQEVAVTLEPKGFVINNIYSNLEIQLIQNHRWSTLRSSQKPSFVSAQQIVYDKQSAFIFDGNNEFYQFGFKNVNYPGGVAKKIERNSSTYEVFLLPNEISDYKAYVKQVDLNGKFTINQDSIIETSITASYFPVYFTLESPKNLYDTLDVYILGGFNMWKKSENNRMAYNSDKMRYEATLLLKQGYYDYVLAYIDNKETIISKPIVGSYSQTENEYEIFVYFYDSIAMYDRVIAYKKINSNSQ